MRLALVTLLVGLTLGAYGCADAGRDSNDDLSRAQRSDAVRQADGSTIKTAISPEAADKAADKTKEGLEKAKDAAAEAAEAASKGINQAGKQIKKAGQRVKDKVIQ